MAIQKLISGTDCELILEGRIDGVAANEFEVEALSLAKSPVQVVTVNLAGANFLCSAALRVLLQHHRQWKNQGRRFVVSRTSPEVDQILDLTGMRDLLVEKV